ncbi:MAG TPA: type II toxin-antitoxin system prevent-host-death family antitoxin [Herpetosiphonaceae bacterium]|nr:type II toxin-antitoxin system prevent-host-death family antitoxin [Herpetosiphonaceae bacterium]
MDEIGAFEAKTKLGALLDRVEAGEEIVITRRGKAVARLVPNTRAPDANEARAAFARIRARAAALNQPFDWEEWKGFRDEGRE